MGQGMGQGIGLGQPGECSSKHPLQCDVVIALVTTLTTHLALSLMQVVSWAGQGTPLGATCSVPQRLANVCLVVCWVCWPQSPAIGQRCFCV